MNDFNIMEVKAIDVVEQIYIKIEPNISQDDLQIVLSCSRCARVV
jgi:hypothetical protein